MLVLHSPPADISALGDPTGAEMHPILVAVYLFILTLIITSLHVGCPSQVWSMTVHTRLVP